MYLQISLVLLIPNCTRQRMIAYTNIDNHAYAVMQSMGTNT